MPNFKFKTKYCVFDYLNLVNNFMLRRFIFLQFNFNSNATKKDFIFNKYIFSS